MNILTTPDEIENKICSLMNSYKTISFASAWASANSKAFQTLLKNIDKVKKIVVGIHFYQTNPNFIKEFIDNDKVKFITNPSGIFHPKIYLFINNNNDWECLVGSANFTKSAFEKNSEIMINISNDDVNSKEVFNTLINEINEFHKKATIFTNSDLNAYQIIWNKKSKKILDLQDDFSKDKDIKPIFKSKIIMQNWKSFFEKVKKDKNHSFEIRLELLEKANQYFTNNTFEKMTEIERKQISGITSEDSANLKLDWKYFGNMGISPRFITRISDSYSDISKALEYIPLQGNVAKNDYINYIEYFKMKKGYGYGVSTTSRLLTMKRPDIFFCITKGNRTYLYEDFGIKKDIESHEYERYWDEIIQRIHKSEWFNIDEPKDPIEKKLWKNRVAMLDAIFYSGGL